MFKMARRTFNKRPLATLRKMAQALLQPAIPSVFEFSWWDHPSDFGDDHAEYLRMLEIAEQGFNQQGQGGVFHYAETAHLYPHL